MVSFKNVSSVGGDGTIPLAFEENVPKYDASSFYNWEQDNIPIWVLEQRGDTLYRAMGFPGGNPEGVTFTLSSTGNFDESRGIYDTIEAITERIPKRLKFPVLIELCTYGNLGKLDLANITCEGNGKLEVKNKVYFEDVNASAYWAIDVSGSPAGVSPFINGVYSPDASSNMINVSSTRGGTKFSDQDNWNENARIVCIQGPDTDRQSNNVTVHVASGNTNIGSGTAPAALQAGAFSLQPYDSLHDRSIDLPTGDAMAFFGSSTFSSMLGYKRNETYTRGQSTLFGFGNWFSSINIKDCQGTVILRNVLSDSSNNKTDEDADGCQHLVDYGWNIENSEVILDNTAAFRAIKAGYYVKNSRLNITGHFMGWRNYTKTGDLASERLQDGAGILAFNTHFTWDKTPYLNSRKYLNWFGKSKRGMDLRSCTTEGGISWGMTSTSAVPNGGSQLLGYSTTSPYNGTSWTELSGGGGDTLTTILKAEGCNGDGLYLEGCDFEFSGRIDTYLNVGNGLHARRSQLRLPQITSNHNSEYGINLDGSQLTYGYGIDGYGSKADAYASVLQTAAAAANGLQSQTNPTRYALRNRAQFNVDSNNQNLLVTRSSAINPQAMNGIPGFYGHWGGSNWINDNQTDTDQSIGVRVAYLPGTHFGATPYRANNKPGFVTTNNSDMEIVNLSYATPNIDTGKGKVAIASNGSNMIFRGTSGGTTTINNFPVADMSQLKRSWLTAGLVATDNSTCELTGPTKLARYGIPLLAEKSSQIMVKPPTLVGTDNILDVSGYTLIKNGPRDALGFAASANHTSLEVHSTRACMVANKNSGIILYGLGGQPVGGNNYAIDSVDVLTTSYQDTFLGDQHDQFLLSTSGGYVKFYPNGFTSAVLGAFGDATELALTDGNADSFFTSNRRLTAPTSQGEDKTTGGMVARAVGDSYLDLNLVNFYNFLQPSSVSGAYYNLSGRGCEKSYDYEENAGGIINEPPGEVGGGGDNPGWVGADSLEGGTEPGATGAIAFGAYGNGLGGNNWNPTGQWWSVGRLVNGTNTNRLGSHVNGTAGMYQPLNGGNAFASMGGLYNPLSQGCIGENKLGEGVTNNDYQHYMYSAGPVGAASGDLTIDPRCMGSMIQIWNISDTSRIHASNCLINNEDPETFCIGTGTGGSNTGSNHHGPFGKWWNGVSLDYFGLAGRRTTYGALGNAYHNGGMFRLILGSKGDLKGMYDVSSLSGTIGGSGPYVAGGANQNQRLAGGWNATAFSGGSPVDQVNGAGYTHFTQNTRMLDSAGNRRMTGWDTDMPQTTYQSSACLRVFGWGVPSPMPYRGVATMPTRMVGHIGWNTVSGTELNPSAMVVSSVISNPPIPPPPLHMEQQGYMRNWFDETGANVWQNVKHLAEDKVNGVSIYRSHMGGMTGGEGRDGSIRGSSYGLGVRSLNLFDLERLI